MNRTRNISVILGSAILGCFAGVSRAADPVAAASFHNDLRPLLNARCNACHKPDKTKGDLDMTTYASLIKGGKNGSPVTPGDPGKSLIVAQVTGGHNAEMPPEGEPLTPQQVDLIARWVKEGAKDDTPAPGTTHVEPPVYVAPPVISAMAFSPDGSLLAVSGYHEVLLHKSDGSGLIARLTGEASRIESITFNKDGRLLGVAGGAPGEFGQVQVWDVAARKTIRVAQPSTDSLYGLSFSPDSKYVAFGGADKIARVMGVDDGKMGTEFKAHADWVLATAFTLDGKQLVTAGRDRAMKLVDVDSGRFVDDINNPLEPITCIARNPKQEQVIYGGDLGVARIYKISDNQGRTSGRNDTNLVTVIERQPGPVTAVAYNPEGTQVAIGSLGSVRIYDVAGKAVGGMKPETKAENAKKGRQTKKTAPSLVNGEAFALSDNDGPVYAVAWKPDGSLIATGGFDGTVRLYDAKTGSLVQSFIPVPLKDQAAAPATQPAAALKP